MNSYRVKYSVNGEEGSANIVAHDEGWARKEFKKVYKAIGETTPEITAVELISENAIATKQQERDTLEKIRQLVADLGPQSYLATAFDGCFEDAESNIENDFAESMKGRYESAKKDAKYFQQAASTFSNNLDSARSEIQRLTSEKDELLHRIPTPDDLTDCIALIKDKAAEEEQMVKDAAEKIVELSDKPDTTEFRQAVQDHKTFKAALEYERALQSRLESISAWA